MDTTTENQVGASSLHRRARREGRAFRASKIGSRLPAPSTQIGGGLTEWSESQHNARIQSSVPAPASWKNNLKREIPQPAAQSEAKRKPLADRALEYPTKPSLATVAATARSTVKGQTITGISQGVEILHHHHHHRHAMGALATPEQTRSPSGSRLRRINSSSALLKTNPYGDVRPLFGRLHDFHLSFSFQNRDNDNNFRFLLASGTQGRNPQRHATLPGRLNDKLNDRDGPHFLKQPTSFQSRQLSNASTASSTSSFAKSVGPGRQPPVDRPQTSRQNGRPGHARSKSQAPRPRTAHGLRERDEDRFDAQPSGNGTAATLSQRLAPALAPLHRPKVRAVQSASTLSLHRDSSLTSRFNQLSLEDAAWDVDGRVGDMESQFKELKEMVNTTLIERKGHENAVELAKTRVKELETDREKLEMRNEALKDDLDTVREEGRQMRHEIEKQKWDFTRQIDDLNRKHRETVDDLARQHRSTVDEMTRELDHLKEQATREHEQRLEGLTRHYQQEMEDERQKKDREIQEMRTRMGNEYQDMDVSLQRKERELQEFKSQLEGFRGDLERERALKGSLQINIAELSASNTTLEAKINSLKSHVEFLESDSKAQSDSFSSMEARLQEALRAAELAQEKLIKEETERRVLFNKYQELKGNIRVMCRVRPALGNGEGQEANMSFPDEKTSSEIVLAGPEERSSLGNVTRKNYPFEFDRVFIPGTQNEEIFGEISQLVQSALDGYNVCIFCYGQTGSGKTHTMSSPDGMIPRATHMIYDTITKLKEKSWTYTMEGSFVEVYNEELNDLLTPNERTPESRSRKLEIRHDEARKQTTIMNCKSVRLNSPSSVETMLEEAQNNRSVAATKANERSSRSHSVFVLKLVGENSATGERCEGTLNLVDLAGSERLKHSQAEGDRMKETQNINKSLSCLGDVIEALGRGSGHVPYRNSKLTHLLQYSLGGNSKTLMFVMVSPLETHLKETLTSLRFATKVHNTHIGTAKATKKVRGDSY
ncbi:Kinesin-like protein klpA [Neonectria ditissima]|uniref:Kinesin-like protein n=1 Tax=Neonectria ditissima TaxID=78410 RepID=A0A0P7BBC7_9HYPO|nr:Kinesin-like protein klpA [Neonectria ditissima]